MKIFYGILFLLLITCQCIAQKIKTDSIKQVTITEKRVVIEVSPSQTIDSNIKEYFRSSSLSSLLQMNTNVFVKNYGVGGLNTISIRGSSAAQTQVLWNGIPINNAMTGIADFNALPVSFFDQIQIEYGSMIKNPIIGGSIILKNEKPIFTKSKSIHLAYAYESLQNNNILIGANVSWNQFANRLRIHYGSAKNNYQYENQLTNEQVNIRHASANQLNLLNESSFKLNTNNTLSWYTWVQFYQREIPPATFETISAKEETSATYRTLLKWDRQYLHHFDINTSLGMFIEKYQFQDSLIQLNTKASTLSIPYLTNISWRVRWNHNVSLQLKATKSFLLDNHKSSIDKAGCLAAYTVDNIFKRFNAKAMLQYELSNLFKVPLVGTIQCSTKPYKGFSIYNLMSSNYRMPTLNELYFEPGGNLNLKPEKGKSIEGGLNLHRQNKNHELQSECSVYTRKVDNWISWFGSSILTPHNIQKVWSRGVDAMLDYEYTINNQSINDSSLHKDEQIIEVKETKNIGSNLDGANLKIKDLKGRYTNQLKLRVGLLYAYTLSTTEKSLIENDYSIGKQIPYVPRYQIKAKLGIRWKFIDMQYIQTYTGYRFVTSDESQYLKPYFTGNIFSSCTFLIHQTKMQMTFRCNNIYNSYFESIVGRPMPLRNFSIGSMVEIQ